MAFLLAMAGPLAYPENLALLWVKLHLPEVFPVSNSVKIILKSSGISLISKSEIIYGATSKHAHSGIKNPGQIIDVEQKESRS